MVGEPYTQYLFSHLSLLTFHFFLFFVLLSFHPSLSLSDNDECKAKSLIPFIYYTIPSGSMGRILERHRGRRITLIGDSTTGQTWGVRDMHCDILSCVGLHIYSFILLPSLSLSLSLSLFFFFFLSLSFSLSYTLPVSVTFQAIMLGLELSHIEYLSSTESILINKATQAFSYMSHGHTCHQTFTLGWCDWGERQNVSSKGMGAETNENRCECLNVYTSTIPAYDNLTISLLYQYEWVFPDTPEERNTGLIDDFKTLDQYEYPLKTLPLSVFKHYVDISSSVVVNFGLHQGNMGIQTFVRLFRNIASVLAESMQKYPNKHHVFRSVYPTHFGGGDSGEYNSQAVKNSMSCEKEAKRHFLDTIEEALSNDMHIPFISFHHLWKDRGEFHSLMVRKVPKFADCAHYCYSYELWYPVLSETFHAIEPV